MKKNQTETQGTENGHEIPIPKHGDFFSDPYRASKPDRKSKLLADLKEA